MSFRILIVDDVPLNLKLLEFRLKKEYYQVFSASNGKEAIELVSKLHPDIILMDAVMPEIDGFTATKLIKQNPEHAHIPIIIITALNDMEDRIKGLMCGADDFLTKPINHIVLLLRVKSLIRLKLMIDSLLIREQNSKQLHHLLGLKGILSNESVFANSHVALIEESSTEAKKHNEVLANHLIKSDIYSINNNTFEDLVNNSTKQYCLIIINSAIEGEILMICSQIRSYNILRNIPIIIILDRLEYDFLGKAFEIGINDYLISPSNEDEFLARCLTQIKKFYYHQVLQSNYINKLSISVLDSLTKIYNRNYFEAYLPNVIENSKSSNKLLFLMILDLDNFKNINDTYGHFIGDLILQEFACRLLQNLRVTDLCARLGGEEFVVVLYDTTKEQGELIAQRILDSISSKTFEINSQNHENISCTCSIGAGVLEYDETPNNFLQRIDKYLYRAKKSGKNKIATIDSDHNDVGESKFERRSVKLFQSNTQN